MLRRDVLPLVNFQGTLAHFFLCLNQKAILKKLGHIQLTNVRLCRKETLLFVTG